VKLRWLYRLVGFGPVLDMLEAMPPMDADSFTMKMAAAFGICATNMSPPLPAQTKTIFVATHHTGAVDFLAGYSVLRSIAPKLKVVLNRALLALHPLAQIALPVHPPSTGRPNHEARHSIAEHLGAGGNVLVFPAGRVGIRRGHRVVDLPWRHGIGEVARDSARAVVPVYIDAENSARFYWLRRVQPSISMFVLMRELVRVARPSVPVYVGEPVLASTLQNLSGADIVSRLRERAYALDPRAGARREMPSHVVA